MILYKKNIYLFIILKHIFLLTASTCFVFIFVYLDSHLEEP
jgi:hypothetical protein